MANIYDMASAIQQPNAIGNFNQGVKTGQQNQVFGEQQAAYQQALAKQQQVQNLAPQIIAGDPNAADQAAAIDPTQAAQYQDAATQHIKRIQGAVNYIDSQQTLEAKEAAYQQVKPYLSQFGTPPATFAEAAPKMEAARAQIAQLGAPETTVMTPGSQLAVKGTGVILHSTPFADKIINNAPVGPNGEKGVISVNPGAGGQGTIVGLGGQPAASSPAFYGAVNDLAGKYGATITSGVRSPEHNAEVGGVPNSQHLTGTAADVVIPPDQKQAFIDDAKSRGLQPIDEGDHVHLQNPNGGAGVSGVRLAIGNPAPKVNSWQQRIDAAKSLGATAGEQKAMVLGASGMQNAQASELTPGALENSTWAYLLNGTLPPVGRGSQGQAQRTAIMNHAADISAATGVNPADMATRAGQQKAMQSSLTAYQKRTDAMQGQEQSFLRNLDYASQISNQVDRSGSPILNKWILGGKENMGDPDVVKLQAALVPVAADYARIMAGSTGAGGTPVSTQQEAMEMLRKELSQKQFSSVADVLRNDVHNQRLGALDQMQVIHDNMSRFGNGSLGGAKPELTPQQRMEGTGAPTAPTQPATGDFSHLWGG